MINLEKNLSKLKLINIKKYTENLLIVILLCLSIYLIYYKSLPRQYDLKPGDTVMVDITSDRSIVDKKATAKRAKDAELSVTKVMARSAHLSNQYLSFLTEYLNEISSKRDEIVLNAVNSISKTSSSPEISSSEFTYSNSRNEESIDEQSSNTNEDNLSNDEINSSLSSNQDAKKDNSDKSEGLDTKSSDDGLEESLDSSTNIDDFIKAYVFTEQDRENLAMAMLAISRDKYSFELSDATANMLAKLPYSIYKNYIKVTEEAARRLLNESLDNKNISTKISSEISNILDTLPAYKDEYRTIGEILKQFILPNVEFDERATRLAKDAAIAQVNANPILIQKGTRIVNVGDILSDEQYKYLEELNLLDTGKLNYSNLAGILIIFLELLLMALCYIKLFEEKIWKKSKSLLSITITSFITVLAGYYLSDFSPYVVVIPFFTIIMSNFYGFRMAFVLATIIATASSLMRFGDSGFLLINIVIAFASAASLSYNKEGTNYLKVILFSFLPLPPIMLAVGLIRDLPSQDLVNSILISSITAALSAMAAIGFTPIIEVLEAKVSPMKLTNLSHPGNILLRRLFFEAPGTNQHSMMVATLAEAAAEAISADSLFCRVASYYHDIGKLENPLMFTENQEGYNPHDEMTAEESFRAIINHVEAGINIGRRYRLPEPILDIIREHHGTTVLFYFYNKAVKQAEEQGLPLPNLDDFRYPYLIPQSKESGIIMLADTVEAAVKSMQLKSTAEVRKLARKLLRQKNEQEQLIESGLSYDEVEKILLAFERVYQGQLHERVKYPEPHKNIKLHK